MLEVNSHRNSQPARIIGSRPRMVLACIHVQTSCQHSRLATFLRWRLQKSASCGLPEQRRPSTAPRPWFSTADFEHADATWTPANVNACQSLHGNCGSFSVFCRRYSNHAQDAAAPLAPSADSSPCSWWQSSFVPQKIAHPGCMTGQTNNQASEFRSGPLPWVCLPAVYAENASRSPHKSSMC